MTLEELNMPKVVHQLCKYTSGMILVTGKTGSGKSTTLAAMIDEMNRRMKGHILTIEDPIEFVHKARGCLISQREVGVHSPNFAEALHSALREDPDVILVGEMRDLETISIAVTAAEMGILVMGTLHTNGAAQTVDRIINSFPADKQSHIRTMISTSLRGVVSQQLLPTIHKPGRAAALEIMINTPAVANLIRQGKLDQLETAIQSGGASGMVSMDKALMSLVEKGWVSGHEAYLQANNKHMFELRVQRRPNQSAGPRWPGSRHSASQAKYWHNRAPCQTAHEKSSLPVPCRTPMAHRIWGISSSTSRPTSGSASRSSAAMTAFTCAHRMRTARRSCSRRANSASRRRN